MHALGVHAHIQPVKDSMADTAKGVAWMHQTRIQAVSEVFKCAK